MRAVKSDAYTFLMQKKMNLIPVSTADLPSHLEGLSGI